MSSNADKPAKPILKASKEQGGVVNHEYEGGLTKRERFAMAAMQGLCAGRTEYESPGADAKDAVKIADALLKELEQTND